MPTEIRIVLPTPGLDDVLSVADALSVTDDNISINEFSSLEDTDQPQNNTEDPFSDTNKFHADNPSKPSTDNIKTEESSESSESKIFHSSSNVKIVSQDTKTTKSSVADTTARCIRSAKIERLLHQSSRESLVTGVRHDIHRPKSSHQNRPKKKKITKQLQQQNNEKEVLPKKQNKSSQTGEDENEGDCQNKTDDKSEKVKLDDVNLTTGKTSPKKQIRPSSSPARLRQRPVSPKPRTVQNVKLSITGTYDIDLEHRDIMMKALNSYHKHRHIDKTPRTDCNENTIIDVKDDSNDKIQPRTLLSDSDNIGRHSLFRKSALLRDILATVGDPSNKGEIDSLCSTATNSPRINPSVNKRVQLIYDDDKLLSRIWTDEKKNEAALKRSNRNTNSSGLRVRPQSCVQSSSSMSSFESDKTFRLARCRLIYNDEPKKTKSRARSSNSWIAQPSRLKDDATSGVLVDSVGHVYGRSKPRPLSALPCKFHIYLQERSRAHYDGGIGGGGWSTDRRYYP